MISPIPPIRPFYKKTSPFILLLAQRVIIIVYSVALILGSSTVGSRAAAFRFGVSISTFRYIGPSFIRHHFTSLATVPQRSLRRKAFAPNIRNHQVMSASSKGLESTTSAQPVPPVAFRDEVNGFVYAGVAPESWDSSIPRQTETSTEPLIDPPVRVADPYHWMRDDKRTNEQVLQHLRNENDYTNAVTQHLQQNASDGKNSVVDTLYHEMLSVIQETDYTTPRPNKDFMYYTRTIQGKAYTIHCRAPRDSHMLWNSSMSDDEKKITPISIGEQITLDINDLAVNQSYCSVGSVKASPSQQLLAYTVDFTGDEKCTLFIKNLVTQEIVHDNDASFEIYGSIQWGMDTDTTVYYLKLDHAQRPFQVYRRTFYNLDDSIFTTITKTNTAYVDTLLFEDLDDSNWVGIYKSKDDRFLFIEASSKETTEIHYIDLSQPLDSQEVRCIAPRRQKVLYEVDHRDGFWWICSNVNNLPNMALFTAPAVPNCQNLWTMVTSAITAEPIFDGGYTRSLDGVTCFVNHVVAYGREEGIPRVWIIGEIQTEGSTEKTAIGVHKFERLAFAEDAYDVGLGTNYEYDTSTIVVTYDSMISPTQSIEINMDDTAQRVILKEKIVPGYEKSLYHCERLTLLGRDRVTRIPISMVYRADVMEHHVGSNQPVPVHLYGYGSYGACMEADFVATRLPLLNRGIVYVIAHVRGGGEMGRTWYEEPNGGKYLCKKNSFNDFCDTAKWLIHEKNLTTPDLLSCEGRSAGGLLIGASINQAPEFFKVAILGVPFVDVVPTMIDASIPLTAGEWEEWGNPNEEKYHQYMIEYTPTVNVQHAKYPACLLTGGLHDPRVQVSFIFSASDCIVFISSPNFVIVSVLGTGEVCR
jgi:oligopeptidase B